MEQGRQDPVMKLKKAYAEKEKALLEEQEASLVRNLFMSFTSVIYLLTDLVYSIEYNLVMNRILSENHFSVNIYMSLVIFRLYKTN